MVEGDGELKVSIMMDGVGIIGALLLAFCGLPQALKSIRDGHSLGISHWFVWMWFWGEIFTLLYVYQKHGFDIPLFTNYFMNILVILIIIKYKYFPSCRNLISCFMIFAFLSVPPLLAQEAPGKDPLPLAIVQIQRAIIEDYQLPVENKIMEEWVRKTNPLEAAGPLSGAQKVELMRQQRKAHLATKKDLVKKQQKNTSSDVSLQDSVARQEQWVEEKGQQVAGWIQQRQEAIDRWQEERVRYRNKIPQYSANLTPFSEVMNNSETVNQKSVVSNFKNRFHRQVHKIELPIFPETFYVEQAFVPAIKDQGTRPTCAAFATMRGVEILAAQQGLKDTFSEQYFYWASRPDCQQQPCHKRGSWALTGLLRSQQSLLLDLPTSVQCPYQAMDIADNQTQLPLATGCFQGKAKIKRFSSTQDFNQVGRALKNNYPIIGAFFLSESFYQNNGYVFLTSKSTNHKMDQHGAGHVLLIVGQMALPTALESREGKYCLIVANSWGEGFGQGGYSCLSEKWLLKYHYSKAPFLVLEEIEVGN